MENISIQKKIIKHLDGLNELERQEGPQKMIQTLAARYDVPVAVIEKALAEWQAGQVDDDNLESL